MRPHDGSERLTRRKWFTAEANQIDHFVADVLPDNHEMLAVFHDGFDPIQHRDEGS